MDERMFKMLAHWTEKERHSLEALRDESRELKVRGSLIVRRCRGYLLFAEKYGGNMLIDFRDNMFTLSIMLPIKT